MLSETTIYNNSGKMVAHPTLNVRTLSKEVNITGSLRLRLSQTPVCQRVGYAERLDETRSGTRFGTSILLPFCIFFISSLSSSGDSNTFF